MSNPEMELVRAEVAEWSERRESRDWEMLEEALVEVERSSWLSEVVRQAA